MISSLTLLKRRRFLPLFVTQFLNAFNDNLYRTALVMLVTFEIYTDAKREAMFSAAASAIFILPFFLLSAMSGQLADFRDKTMIIRWVKSAEIGIMLIGSIGLLLHNIPLMLLALFAMGIHSTFLGPIKYAILPQHLAKDEVLPGTGLVEAGTYLAILLGTIVGGAIQGAIRDGDVPRWSVAAAIISCALLGRAVAQYVPPAPAEQAGQRVDHHLWRSSVELVRSTLQIPKLFLAIMAISFFWMIGAVLAAQFPPLVKNILGADEGVATLMLAIFSVGVAVGSIIINRLLKGEVSARWSPGSAIVMGGFLVLLWWLVSGWQTVPGRLLEFEQFISNPRAELIIASLFGVAVSGGMFVVPLYAFLTTTVPKSETARTVAANNIVNSGAMVFSVVGLAGVTWLGLSVAQSLLLVAGGCLGAALIAVRLVRACRAD
jgi:MFS family permease